ncbi:MAG TPA: hypothetical protein VI159_00360 [Gemmatimonadales bacterium]
MTHRLMKAFAIIQAGVLVAGPLQGQARANNPVGTFWVMPYVGVGFENRFYDGIVTFSNAKTKSLLIDPGSAIVVGAEAGYRFRAAWSVYAGVSTSSPTGQYIENLTLQPDVTLKTTKLDAGVLYDVLTMPVGGKSALLSIGGGISLTMQSLHQFSWKGNTVEPSSSSAGLHALAALDIPLGSKLSFNAQTKLTVSSLARGNLQNEIALAEGGGVTAQLDSRTLTDFLISGGLRIRF